MYLVKNPMYRSQSNVGMRLKPRLAPGGLLRRSYTCDALDYKVANNDKNLVG